MSEPGDKATDDAAAPAWASALLQVMNDRFDKVDAQLVAIEKHLDRIIAKTEQAADELKQVNATMDRIIVKMTAAPEGRG